MMGRSPKLSSSVIANVVMFDLAMVKELSVFLMTMVDDAQPC